MLRDGSSARTLVSRLTYADGREVPLFRHHQCPVPGTFSGVELRILEFRNALACSWEARKIYLEAHVDGLFWLTIIRDPASNVTTGNVQYRNTSADMDNLIAQQNAFNSTFNTLTNFKLDMVFSRSGAVIIPARKETLVSDADAWFIPASMQPVAWGHLLWLYRQLHVARQPWVAFKFPINAPYNPYANSAVLNLTGSTSSTSGQICRITAPLG